MSFQAYVDYILGETNVEAAIVAGMSEAEARTICTDAFAPLFGDKRREIRFRAVFAVAQKALRAPEGEDARASTRSR